MSGYSANDNQNYFVSDGHTTSRVLQPPGGQSSFSLGTAPPSQPKPVAAPVAKAAPVKVAAPEPPKKAVAPSSTTNSSTLPQQSSEPVSANSFASGANMNGAQVMTGRPTSRVLQPPGGKSSFSLGC